MASQITSLTIVCLLNRLFRPSSKKTSKLRVTGLCVGNSPVTGEFPTQRASNAEKFPFDYVIMLQRGNMSHNQALRNLKTASYRCRFVWSLWKLTTSRRDCCRWAYRTVWYDRFNAQSHGIETSRDVMIAEDRFKSFITTSSCTFVLFL